MVDKFTFRFFVQYLKINLLSAWEYRVSFLSQYVGMVLNDILWLVFWVMFFTRFQNIGGWGRQDIVILWSTITVSYGVAVGFFANCRFIPEVVEKGQMDFYLTIPRNSLFHLLIAKISPSALGDLIFGIAVFFLFCNPTPGRVLLYLVVTALATAVFVGFFVFVGSFAFFLQRAETLGNQALGALLHFSTYPASIFGGGTKVLLYTVIPAGFISYIPVELLRQFSWALFLELIAAAAFFLGLGIVFFNLGLRKYESGNLIQMRE